jgi:hypothetical protein
LMVTLYTQRKTYSMMLDYLSFGCNSYYQRKQVS